MTNNEKALELVQKCLDDWPYAATRVFDIMKRLEQVKVLLKEQPEQKHGHWIRSPKFLPETQCSVCKNTYVGDCRTFKFCPECGARMDEEVKQDG